MEIVPSIPTQNVENQEVLMGPRNVTPLQQNQTQQGVTQNESPWPKVLAIAAAVSGDFGPLIQFHEQKRRTEVYKQLSPVLKNVQSLVNLGQFDQAQKYADEAFATFGSRSPEIGQYIGQLSAGIQKKHADYLNLQADFAILDASVPKDAPGRKYVDAIGKLVKLGVPYSMENARNMMTRFANQVQQFEGKTTITNPMTMEQKTIAQPAIARIGDIPEFTQRELVSKYGMPIHDIVNALNTEEPVKTESGIDIRNDLKENIKYDISRLAQVENDIYLRSKSPTTAEYNEALRQSLLAGGMSPDEANLRMATGQFGEKDHQAARLSAQAFAVQKAVAPIRASLLEDVYGATKAGLVSFVSDPKSNKFGSPEYVPHAEFLQRNDLSYVPFSVHNRIVDATRALSGLDYVDLMYKELNDPNAPISRLSTGLYRTIVGLTGFPIDDPKAGNVTVAKAAEMIANRSIEQVEKTQTVSDPTVGQLKALIVGRFADPVAAKQAKELLKNRLWEELSIYSGRNDVPKTDIESMRQKEIENVKEKRKGKYELTPVR